MKKINNAILLGAGFGTRMMPLSKTVPKPLIEVCGQPQIKYIFDTVADSKIKNIFVNAHYLSDKMVDYFKDLDVTLIVEDKVLETGGGVKNILDHLGDVFVVANTDSIVIPDKNNFIDEMIQDFDDSVDGLLLVIEKEKANNYTGTGDLDIGENGNVIFNPNGKYVFCGVQILRKSCFDDTPDGAFSLRLIYDKLEQKNRLKALVHTGKWYHISTPEDVDAVNKKGKL